MPLSFCEGDVLEKSGIHNSRDLKIAIIGAGISGLTAAHTLKKLGYRNITILEALDRIGGKVYTVEKDGYLYEIGAIVLLEDYKIIPKLAKEFNISLTKRSINTLIRSNGKQKSLTQYLYNKHGILEIIKSQLLLYKLLSKHKKLDIPGFADADPELYVNFREFARKNKIEPIATVFEAISAGYGYGYIDTTPALYYLKVIRSALSLSIKDLLNSLFGLSLSTMIMFDRGFQTLPEKMAQGFDVRLNSRVTDIARERNGNSFKVSITANEKTEIFDRVIISSVPAHTMKFLDMNEQEKEIFSKVKSYHFHETLFYGDGLPRNHALFFEEHRNINAKGFPASIGNLNIEHNIFQSFQLHDGEFSSEELEKMLVETIANTGGKVSDIILTETFAYFPHFAEKDLNEMRPYERLDKMQGENGTFFIGGLFNFEDTENTAEYSQYLTNKFFSQIEGSDIHS